MTALYPRRFVTELHLGTLGWVDVSNRVHQESRVTITRAAGSEQAVATPDTSQFSFWDPNDELNPDNPVGPYFDQFRQSPPLRQSVELVREPFTDATTDSWGTAPVTGHAGLPWSLIGTAADFDRTGGRGQIRITAANVFHTAYLPGLVARNARVRATYYPGISAPTGAGIDVSLLLRGTGTDNYYEIRVNVAAGGASTIRSMVVLGGVETVITAAVATGVTHTAGSPLHVVAQADGPRLMGKVYSGSAEPLEWQIDGMDTTDRRPAAGWVGVRVGVASGNTNAKPILFEFDDLVVSKPRFEGRVHRLAPSSDQSHKIKFVKAEAGGALRRLSRPEGGRPLLSAGRRLIEGDLTFGRPEFATIGTRAFWPLEEGFTDEAQGKAQTVGTSSMVFQQETGLTPNEGEIRWGDDRELPSIVGAPTLVNGGRLIGTLPIGVFSGSWGVSWGMRVSPDSGAQIQMNTTTAGQGLFWTFFTDGTLECYRNPGGVLLFSFPYDPTHLGAWHHYAVGVYHVGADTQFFLFYDGESVRANTWAGTNMAPLLTTTFVAPNATNGPLALTQVAVLGHVSTQARLDLWGAMFGWPGERAARRMDRLSREEFQRFSYLGGLDQSEPMGPQRPGDTLLDNYRKAEAIDFGLLHELITGDVAYRTRQHAYNRAPLLTLDYSAGQVAQLVRSRDDRFLANDVTAERDGGGERRRTLTTGPLGTDEIGVQPASPRVNAATDAQLEDVAQRTLQLGTNPRLRMPRVVVDLRAPGLSLAQQIAAMDLEPLDRLLLTNLEQISVYDDVEQLVRGYVEVWGTTAEHQISFNTAPADPWNVGEADAAEHRALDDGTTTLSTSITTTFTGVRNILTTGPVTWTVDASQYPLDVMMGGERITVSGITGGGGGQQMTIATRSVNGVVKAHAAGTVIRLFERRSAG